MPALVPSASAASETGTAYAMLAGARGERVATAAMKQTTRSAPAAAATARRLCAASQTSCSSRAFPRSVVISSRLGRDVAHCLGDGRYRCALLDVAAGAAGERRRLELLGGVARED